MVGKYTDFVVSAYQVSISCKRMEPCAYIRKSVLSKTKKHLKVHFHIDIECKISIIFSYTT